MESDKKLDKLENFLGRLNSKGVYVSAVFKLLKRYFYQAKLCAIFTCSEPLKNLLKMIVNFISPFVSIHLSTINFHVKFFPWSWFPIAEDLFDYCFNWVSPLVFTAQWQVCRKPPSQLQRRRWRKSWNWTTKSFPSSTGMSLNSLACPPGLRSTRISTPFLVHRVPSEKI